MFKNILVAVDFAHSSDRALDIAGRMAAESGAKLTLVTAFDASGLASAGTAMSSADLLTASEEAAKAQLETLLATVRRRVPAAQAVVRHGPPTVCVLEAAKDLEADLIVVGTHARHGMERLLVGSVAEAILRDSAVPVLVVRAFLA